VGRGRPTKLRSALPLLSCRSPLGRGQISVDRRLHVGVHRLERARDLIVRVLIEQLLESLGIELAARHAKLARAFLRRLKEWSRNRDGCLHSPSITQLYRCLCLCPCFLELGRSDLDVAGRIHCRQWLIYQLRIGPTEIWSRSGSRRKARRPAPVR
jgi:hypothetical protein